MGAAIKFLFERRFGPDDEADETEADAAVGSGQSMSGQPTPAPEPEAPPLFTQEDLERVRAETLAFARKQAEAQAARAADAAEDRIARALEAIGERLPELVRAQHEGDAAQARRATKVALAAVRKLFPNLNDAGGADEVVAVVDAAMARIVEAPKLAIRVSGPIATAIAPRVEALAEVHGFAGQITVSADDTVADGDCRLSWAGGGAVRDASAILAAIDQAVERTLPVADGDGTSGAEESEVENEGHDRDGHDTGIGSDSPAQANDPLTLENK